MNTFKLEAAFLQILRHGELYKSYWPPKWDNGANTRPT